MGAQQEVLRPADGAASRRGVDGGPARQGDGRLELHRPPLSGQRSGSSWVAPGGPYMYTDSSNNRTSDSSCVWSYPADCFETGGSSSDQTPDSCCSQTDASGKFLAVRGRRFFSLAVCSAAEPLEWCQNQPLARLLAGNPPAN